MGLALGGLGWSPEAFRAATPDELWAAIEHRERAAEAMREAARG